METESKQIMQWVKQGFIKKSDIKPALQVSGILPDTHRWILFIEHLFLWLGMLALSFSVVFFIAYNWDAMGRFAKFAIIEGLIMACLIFNVYKEKDRALANMSIVAASILLGVLLAFYGQTYQTGADKWELFAWWALLILPWVIITRLAALWLIFVILINISLWLYHEQMGRLFEHEFFARNSQLWLLAIPNMLIWIGWEILARYFSCLNARWAIRFPAVTCGTALTILLVEQMFSHTGVELQSAVLYALIIVVANYVYRIKIYDLFMLASLCLSVIIVVTGVFARIFSNSGDTAGLLFILSLLVVGMSALAINWLRKIHRQHES